MTKQNEQSCWIPSRKLLTTGTIPSSMTKTTPNPGSDGVTLTLDGNQRTPTGMDAAFERNRPDPLCLLTVSTTESGQKKRATLSDHPIAIARSCYTDRPFSAGNQA